jgi:hypothetical protein
MFAVWFLIAGVGLAALGALLTIAGDVFDLRSSPVVDKGPLVLIGIGLLCWTVSYAGFIYAMATK